MSIGDGREARCPHLVRVASEWDDQATWRGDGVPRSLGTLHIPRECAQPSAQEYCINWCRRAREGYRTGMEANWNQLLDLALTALVAYVGVVLIIRVAGNRALAKLNAFDFIVTIALGSILATTVVSAQVDLVTGMMGFGLLVAFQYLATLAIRRWSNAQKVAKAAPTLLLIEGRMLENALSRSRITAGDVFSAVRAAGYGDQSSIVAVVLETDGSLSVVPRSQVGDGSLLSNLRGSPT